MQLSDYELLPGVIFEVSDPKAVGRVKAIVPTQFDLRTMSANCIPWIYPITMRGYQHFSKMENGCKIWVLHNTKYPDLNEYWYFPMVEYNVDTMDIIKTYDNTELLISRLGDNASVYVYYRDCEGFCIKIGADKSIIVGTDGKITINNHGVNVVLEGGECKIGNDVNGEYQPTIKMKEAKETLIKAMKNLMNALMEAGSSYPLQPLATSLMKIQGAGWDNLLDSDTMWTTTTKVN